MFREVRGKGVRMREMEMGGDKKLERLLVERLGLGGGLGMLGG
jgi:hypothetical protein